MIPNQLKPYAHLIRDVDRDGDGAWNVGLKNGFICSTSETHAVFELELDTVVSIFKDGEVVKCDCKECVHVSTARDEDKGFDAGVAVSTAATLLPVANAYDKVTKTKEQKRGRTDVHAPSVIVPEDYEFVAFEHIKLEDIGACAAILANRELIRSHMAHTKGKYSNHAHGGVCMVCGNAQAVYTVIFYHAKTNTYVRMGDTCAQKTEMSYGDMNYFMEACRIAAKMAKGKRAAAEQWKDATLGRALEVALEARTVNQDTQRWESGNKLESMLATTEQYGVLSDKMIKAALWLSDKHDRYAELQAEREQERAAAADAPTGRVRVEGTVLSVKEQASVFGLVTKMTVKAKEGYIVWTTVPRGMGVERGQTVIFMATLTPSHDDKKFAFGKRPTECK